MIPRADPARVGSGATRRTVVGALATAPLVAALARWTGARRRRGAVSRPSATGTSSATCALCGATDHSMLHCPSTPKVR